MIEAMVDKLIVDVPGCPAVTIRDALEWAQGQLCEQGNAWVVEVDLTVDKGKATIALDPSLNAVPVRVMFAAKNGGVLRSDAYHQSRPGEISARIDGDISAGVAVKPKAGHNLPDDMLIQYDEALRCGARWRLLTMPQAWRDASAADFYRREFYEHVTHAKERSWSGLHAGSRRMRTPRMS